MAELFTRIFSPVTAAERGRAQRHLLDDADSDHGSNGDGVADREPALEEHEKAGDDVGQEPLAGEPDQDDDQRRAGQGGHAREARDLDEREREREAVGEVAHGRADERDGGVAPLQAAQRRGVVGRRPRLAVSALPPIASRSRRRGPTPSPRSTPPGTTRRCSAAVRQFPLSGTDFWSAAIMSRTVAPPAGGGHDASGDGDLVAEVDVLDRVQELDALVPSAAGRPCGR